MGLKGDIDEVVAPWRKASWPMKAFLFLSGFLAISSVASLAEQITNWKGFFKDGIDFYRDWISTPIQYYVLPRFGVHLPREIVDLLVLLFLMLGSLVRTFALVAKTPLPEGRYRFFVGGAVFGVFGGVAMVMVMLVSGFNNKTGNPYSSFRFAVAIFIVLCMPLGAFLMFRHPFKRIHLMRLYIMQIAALFFAVGIMAAINVGLSK